MLSQPQNLLCKVPVELQHWENPEEKNQETLSRVRGTRWKASAKQRFAKLLQSKVATADGLFQLAAYPKEHWNFLKAIFTGLMLDEDRRKTYNPPTSITYLRALQGLSTVDRGLLLYSVATCSITQKEMASKVS